MAEKIATREAYGQALVDLADKYDYVVLDADLAEATKTIKFKKAYPERFFDCGIAEVLREITSYLFNFSSLPISS